MPKISYFIAASTLAIALAPAAHAQDRAEAEIRFGSVLATNPFQVADTDAESIALSVEVAPSLVWEDETSTVVLDGLFRYEEWLERYGTDLSGELGLAVEKQASETLQLFGEATFSSRERAAPDLLTGAETGAMEIDTPIADVPFDPTVGDGGLRRDSAEVSFGLDKQLSTTQSLRGELFSTYNWFELDGIDYRTSRLQLEYGQRLSPRLTLLATVSGTKSDFLDQDIGDGTFANAGLGFVFELSSTSELVAQAGGAVARVEIGPDTRETDTFFVASLEFCNEAAKGKLCVSGSRQSRPTSIGGASTVTSAGIGWNRSFERNENLSLNLRYSDTKASLAAFDIFGEQRVKFAAASARYSLPISNALGLYFAPSALKIFDDPLGRETNFQVVLGIGYTFGR